MFLSRKSRVVGRLRSGDDRRIIAASMGALLGKSLHLSEDVFLAMQSRGFRGHPRTLDTFKMQAHDWLFIATLMVVAGFAIWWGR
jgi:cobalt/nickel transport system permease protein